MGQSMKEFIDEFKHLEKICNEIYSEQHGVTQYINEMEQKSGYASRKIPDWDKDLDNLKHVRHIRNNLVHESDDTIDYDLSDIEFIKVFYQKIISQQDPLALLRKQDVRALQSKISNNVRHSNSIIRTMESDDEKDDSLTKALAWGVVLVILIIILLLVIIFV